MENLWQKVKDPALAAVIRRLEEQIDKKQDKSK